MIGTIREEIRSRQDEILEDLIRFCRQPSISAQGTGINQMVDLLVDSLGSLGAKVRVVEFPGGNPAIYGEIPGDSDVSLLFYNHYDVQPPDPLDEWITPPFEPDIRDGKIYARGTSDNKGDLVARLHAVKAFLDVKGSLPLTVKFLIEGEEEIGSVHLGELVSRMGNELKSDGCLWETGGRGSDERIEVALGCKGIAYLELESIIAQSDLHSSNATIVPNPAWRLIWALSSLKNENEEILISGFYDNIRSLTQEEMKTLQDIEVHDANLKESLGVKDFLLGLSGNNLLRRHLLAPTCTICGFISGYTGEGAKTVLPNKARAKVDFRLVPDQKPEDIMRKVERHLAEKGFSDVKVAWSHGVPPYRAPLDSQVATAAREALEDVYGEPPALLLSMPGTGPMYELSGRLNMPTIATGVCYAGSAMHGPNENIRIRDLILGTEAIAVLMEVFARQGK
jgi:acetylornithine deacetylase/succinyl-diaminopimelate desuccinylase-like protein